jgi:hypothetical protein
LMGGLLPFGSIFIEMYFVFTSFWNYKVRNQYIGVLCCETNMSLHFYLRFFSSNLIDS